MPVLIPVNRLKVQCNPIANPPWDEDTFFSGPIFRNGITKAIKENRLISQYNFPSEPRTHMERIAYFVVHGWKDAIQIDVGIPFMQCYVNWIITDGNHRMAAAIYRKDEHILAAVSGSLDYAEELFGLDCTEPTLTIQL
jgi:hypothetical protein